MANNDSLIVHDFGVQCFFYSYLYIHFVNAKARINVMDLVLRFEFHFFKQFGFIAIGIKRKTMKFGAVFELFLWVFTQNGFCTQSNVLEHFE